MIYFVKCIFAKSRYTMSTMLYTLLNNCMTSSKTLNKADRQERPPLNPCWVGFKCSFEIRNVTICLQITLSNTLIITDS